MNGVVLRFLGISFILAVVSPLARSASITWSLAQNISGDSDVSTNGSLIRAFNVGDTGVASTNVNGVTFESFAVPFGSNGATVGNFAIVTNDRALFSDNSAYGHPNPPFATLSIPYQTLLAAGSGTLFGFTLTISGLTAGLQYEFQWWANHSHKGMPEQRVHTATAGNTVTLSDNPTNSEGGLGQFAVGTFIADAATQAIIFDGPVYSFLSGFQLRQVNGPLAVPESGRSLALLAFGLAGLALLRRMNAFRRRG